MKNSILRLAAITAAVLSLSAAAVAGSLNGKIFVKDANGAVHAVPAALETTTESLTLNVAGNSLTSVVAQTADGSYGQTLIGAIFLNPPKSTITTALVLRGVVTDDGDINGDFYVASNITDDSPAALTDLLGHILKEDVPAGLTYESAFSFSRNATLSSKIEQIAIGLSGPRIVYARRIFDQENPALVVGCWTNAGVGRNAEYYSGDCPSHGSYYWEGSANGRVMTAAGFERGVPYSWTRQGQLQALLVGAERTRAFNETYLAYSRPNFGGWGFFFLFPWQIMR